MADKIVVMHDGIVEQVGTPLELYDRPDNLFVAGFIGSPAMNFINGTIKGGKFVSDSGITLEIGGQHAMSEGQKVVYGIRPEHLNVSSAGAAAKVVVVEPTGSETHVVLNLGGQEIICLLRERVDVKPDQTIHIAPQPALVHLFDQATGKRI